METGHKRKIRNSEISTTDHTEIDGTQVHNARPRRSGNNILTPCKTRKGGLHIYAQIFD